MHQMHIEFSLKLQDRWHSGSGEGGLIADRLVRRDSRKRPYLPASTLRGVVREQCERLSRTLSMKEPSDPHSLDRQHFGCPPPAIVDKLFGTKYSPSNLYFRNALPDANDLPGPDKIISRTSMYRVLNTGKDGHLFQTEYAAPVNLFSSISAWNTNLAAPEEGSLPFAYMLLLLGLQATERIGADKSTGKGLCRINIKNINYNSQDLTWDMAKKQMDEFLEIWEIYVEEEGL